MPLTPSEAGAEKIKVEPPIIFDSSKEGLMVPEGASVFLRVYHEGNTPPEDIPMEEAANHYFFEGELQAGGVAYRFFIVPKAESGMASFIHPGEAELPRYWQPGATTETAGEEEAEGGGNEAAEGMDAAGFVRLETRMAISGIFEGLSEIDAKDRRKFAQEAHRRILAFGGRVSEMSESNDARVRETVRGDLAAEIDDVHDRWIAERDDLDDSQKEILATARKRHRFRVLAFNHLCDAAVLGLDKSDRIKGSVSIENANSHMRRKLGRNFGLFDLRLSEYDGGVLGRALHGVASEISGAEDEPGTVEKLRRMRFRGNERARLAHDIANRARNETEDTYGRVEESKGISRFLKSEGGDLAVKWAAIVFYGPLWFARSFTEAAGYDFGEVVSRVAKAPFRLLAQGAKGLINLLPDNVKERAPENMQEWLSRPSAPSFEKLNRVSLTWQERKNLFLKGLVPLPSVVMPPLRGIKNFMQKRFGIWRAKRKGAPAPEFPEETEADKASRIERTNIADKIGAERLKSEGAIDAACQKAFSSLSQAGAASRPAA